METSCLDYFTCRAEKRGVLSGLTAHVALAENITGVCFKPARYSNIRAGVYTSVTYQLHCSSKRIKA